MNPFVEFLHEFNEDSESDNQKDDDSSDDDINVILNGTPEQKRKFYSKISRDEEIIDEFEDEMNKELDEAVDEIETAFLGEARHSIDTEDCGSDEDDVHLGPRISNSELFYDPHIDDRNQRWIDRKRREQRSSKRCSGNSADAAPRSDAILDCPACLSTVCIDCQRHSIYHNQYRAMFVMNCTIDHSKVLNCPEINRKRGKGRNLNSEPKSGKINRSGADASIHISSEPTHNETADCEVPVNMTSAEQSISATDYGEIVTSQLTSADDFYQVRCSECQTVVGVIDNDDVYHFYNIVAAHT